MKLLPLSELHTLVAGELEMQECSNHVYVPGHLFTLLLSTSIVTLQIRNAVEQTVYGRLYSAHMGDRDTVYVPQWMYAALDCDLENCEVSPVTLPSCTAITLQPFNEEDVEEMELLQLALERYTVVSTGQEITLWHPYGYPYAVRVVSATSTATSAATSAADEEGGPVYIGNCEIPLNMLPPLSIAEQSPLSIAEQSPIHAAAAPSVPVPPVVPPSVPPSVPPPLPTPVPPAAAAASAVVRSAEDLRRRCYEAAKRRMEAKEKPE